TTAIWPGLGMTPITRLRLRCRIRWCTDESTRDLAGHGLDGRIRRQEIADALDDILSLRARELGMDRQSERLFGRAFALGERADFVPERLEALLKVHRNGVIDFGSDTLPFQDSL